MKRHAAELIHKKADALDSVKQHMSNQQFAAWAYEQTHNAAPDRDRPQQLARMLHAR